MMEYSQEWFEIKLAKIRDMIHNDLHYAGSETEIDTILSEVSVHVREVKLAIYKIIPGVYENEVHDLIFNHLLVSEADRRAFYASHGIMSEYDCICEQMSASA